MFSYDSLSLKYFFIENEEFIKNSVVQKVQLPSRYEVILTIRNIQTKKLYININPKYPHICFINEKTANLRNITIPKQPPMFCMQLRKYIQGSKIIDFKLKKYDRILEFYFNYFDEIGSLTKICLCAEFMGKYSNIILYNAQNNVIIGSIHNVSNEKSSTREVFGGAKYIYPELKQKLDILDVDKIYNLNDFYYFSKNIIEKAKNYELSYLKDLTLGKHPDFIIDFWGGKDNINDSIDNYFSNEIYKDNTKNIKSKLSKIIKKEIKKLSSIKPMDYSNVEKYKEKADFVKANMYDKEKIKDIIEDMEPVKFIQKYYELYKKKLKAYKYDEQKNEEIKDKFKYFEEILFNIENANSYDELDEIETELIDLNLIKKEKKKIQISNLNKIEYRGYDIYIGKNNIQNNFLLSKIAKAEDIWFHTLNCPSSHIILKLASNKKAPNKDVLEYCARLTKQNSKAKNSGKTPIIMTKRKNLKRPPNTYLGYTTYKNETEIII